MEKRDKMKTSSFRFGKSQDPDAPHENMNTIIREIVFDFGNFCGKKAEVETNVVGWVRIINHVVHMKKVQAPS